ncbi:MAG: S8 family serine peptidase [Candidatus Kapaibacteriota bacterium]
MLFFVRGFLFALWCGCIAPALCVAHHSDSLAANDPRYGEQWYHAASGIDSAWKILQRLPQKSTSPIVIGIIDTGIDYAHPDLAANIFTNPGESGFDTQGRDKRSNGIDDDKNGYIDDWHGWDFVDNDNDPTDTDGHGTHCAGVIGGVINNQQGIAGIVPNVRLLPLRILRSISEPGSATIATAAIDYAVRMGVRITNNSWVGESASPLLQAAFDRAGRAGVLSITAAGNRGQNNDVSPAYPSGFDVASIVSVAALDRTNALTSFSNVGATSVDIAAPGSAILSTEPNNRYGFREGTSQAAPIVTGIAALALLQDSLRSVAELKRLLLRSIDKLPALKGKIATGGKINAWKVLQEQDTIAPARVRGLTSNAPTSSGFALQWLATGSDSAVGAAKRYEVRLSPAPITEQTFEQAILLTDTLTPQQTGTQMSFTVRGLASNTKYFVAVRAEDAWNNFSPIGVTSASTLLRTSTPVVINKFFNSGTADASGDAVELLTLEQTDMRGMILKDFSSNGGSDGGGAYIFRDVNLWSSVSSGTLIVLRKDTAAADTDARDGTLILGLDNPSFFSFTPRNSFNIATEEIVMIKEAGASIAGVSGSLHALGTAGCAGELNSGQAQNAAGFNAIQQPKLRASRGNTGTGQTVYAVNPTALVEDYNGTNAIGSATGLVFGSPNTNTNRNFIDRLRSRNGSTTDAAQVSIGLVRRNVAVPQLGESTLVTAFVVGNPRNVQLAYSINANASTIPTIVEMSRSDSTTFTASIPANAYQRHGDRVEYFVIADSSGMAIRFPRTQSVGFFVGQTPISRLKDWNTDGTLKYNAYSARIKGIPTVSNGVLSTVHLLSYLQDSSGGIGVFRAGAVRTPLRQRYEYTMTGELEQFNGVAQLVPALGNENLVEGGVVAMPEPLPLTIPSITQSLAVAESNEGRLIEFRDVVYQGAWASSDAVVNITLRGADGSQLILRGNRQTLGADPGQKPFSVSGILSQFDTSLPFTSDYQLLAIGDVRQPFLVFDSNSVRFAVRRADTAMATTIIANRGNAPLHVAIETRSDLSRLASENTLPVILTDPPQPNSTEPDVLAIRGGFIGTSLVLKIEFANDIRAVDFTGTLALDMDNNKETGVYPPPNGSAEQTIGAESLLSFSQIGNGIVQILDAGSRAVLSAVPASVLARSITLEVPLRLLQASSSLVRNGISMSAVVGTRARPTDRVPNAGRGAISKQMLRVFALDTVIGAGRQTELRVIANGNAFERGTYSGAVVLKHNDDAQSDRTFALAITIAPRLEAQSTEQNLFAYPNPFTEAVRIEYRVATESFVRLDIVDMLGN